MRQISDTDYERYQELERHARNIFAVRDSERVKAIARLRDFLQIPRPQIPAAVSGYPQIDRAEDRGSRTEPGTVAG